MASLAARVATTCRKSVFPSRQLFAARTMTTHTTSYTLNTSARIPALGLGTFQDAESQEETVSQALQKGMRLIDTARVYNVEEQLWCNDYHPEDVERAVHDSLRDLDTPYVDLLLMHYPCTFMRGAERFPRDAAGRMTGKVKAIGVSNFSKGEIETLLKESSTVPAVHQMEVHPYLQQKGFNEWLRTKGIHVVQFSPLGNMNDFNRQTGWSKEISHIMRVIDQPILKEIGKKYGKSPVQVVLAWGINSGRSVIPKSVVGWQIEENLAADFQLQPEDLAQIATLDAQARFNDPSLDYEWRLYGDLEGIEGTIRGRTH